MSRNAQQGNPGNLARWGSHHVLVRRAHLALERGAHRALPRLELAEEALQVRDALLQPQRGPSGEGGVRGVDRGLHLCGGAGGRVGENLPAVAVGDGKRAARALDPRAVDEVRRVLGGDVREGGEAAARNAAQSGEGSSKTSPAREHLVHERLQRRVFFCSKLSKQLAVRDSPLGVSSEGLLN
jgi:hypothetical protein